MSNSPSYPNTNNTVIDPNQPSMAITKRIHPGALTVDKGSSHRNTERPIPAFVTKLFTMVNDPNTDHLIKWSEPNGDSFFVVSSERFGRELLPKFFKHSNFGSFVRQLNMYGFHKVPHLNQGVLQGEIPETEMLEFTNINFQRSQPDLLCLIRRKKPVPESSNPAPNEPTETGSTPLPSNPSVPHTTDLQAILVDILAIRKHQTLMSSDLKTLQSSNAHLWKEAIANRDRIKRCQDTINKILGFLAQVFAGKVSNLADPPLGGSIPDLDRHRSRAKSSREHHHHPHPNNFDYESSPSNTALSLYSQMRHPRLMLEDTQRPSSNSSTDQSLPLADNVSSFGKSLDGHASLQNLSFNPNNRNHTHSPTPSTHHTSSTTSSPKVGQSSQFQDSSIDPNLETSIDANGTNGQALHNPVSSTNDQFSPDAVLQALFNNNTSTGGFNINDNPFTSINWADLVSSDGLGGFNEDKGEPAMNPPSPLRITDGHSTRPVSRPSSSPMDMNTDSSTQLISNTQRQAHGIESVANKMDSLETAIERLVNNLPDQMEDYLNPSELDKTDQNANPFNASHLSAAEIASDNQADFDADAFLRTLMPPEDRTGIQTRSVSAAANGKQRSDEHPQSQASASMDALDIEKFLDEWTCQDPSRILPGLTPLVSPVPTPRLELNESEARMAGQPGGSTAAFQDPVASSSSVDKPLTTHSIEAPKSSASVAFDLNDDDHLRRIMSSKKSPTEHRHGHSISHPGTAISNPPPHPPRKRLLDDPGPPQSALTPLTSHQLLSNPFNHLPISSQPSSSSAPNMTTTATTTSSPHFIHNKKTRL
ncbi:stress-responsive transcription factor hsf1 [Puccinia graminis f. sp. tritici]|uniref:Stress-responsive transcription factor hsf1 n=1 Tax=Puccinia graminis f. sp. tritici TaxID=56615 RepID=A0A5B0SIH2_PUCGR|nr:stress-responsive transcription factor hsf1 [Puccinia graminis f. sp. tritici]KAA1137758.1 stress-responsive transcription factor hsf1 [Puccinia graminis f. sp. tritici]